MQIKYPTGVNTPEKKIAYLEQLMKLVEIDGNIKGWRTGRIEVIDLICTEICTQNRYFRDNNTYNAKLEDIEGYDGIKEPL